MSYSLADVAEVKLPPAPPDRIHLYYQYCIYDRDRRRLVRSSLRAGLDLEYHHMDVCPDLPLFRESKAEVPGARRTRDAVQVPVYANLTSEELECVARRIRRALEHEQPADRAAPARVAR